MWELALVRFEYIWNHVAIIPCPFGDHVGMILRKRRYPFMYGMYCDEPDAYTSICIRIRTLHQLLQRLAEGLQTFRQIVATYMMMCDDVR